MTNQDQAIQAALAMLQGQAAQQQPQPQPQPQPATLAAVPTPAPEPTGPQTAFSRPPVGVPQQGTPALAQSTQALERRFAAANIPGGTVGVNPPEAAQALQQTALEVQGQAPAPTPEPQPMAQAPVPPAPIVYQPPAAPAPAPEVAPTPAPEAAPANVNIRPAIVKGFALPASVIKSLDAWREKNGFETVGVTWS